MTAIGIRELKNNLSRYLGRVKTGERLLVTELGPSLHALSVALAKTVPRKRGRGSQ